MTQKEIWSGYCARFIEMFAPMHFIKLIGSMFVKKPVPTRKEPRLVQLLREAEHTSTHRDEISKILDTMLKEARNER